MKEMDRDGRLLCELQAKTFEMSVENTAVSSAVFVRRFLNSNVAKWLDNGTILTSNVQPADLLDMIEEQYGHSDYGSIKYTHNEMYWMGYVYRYFSYTYDRSSASVYRMLKPKELRELFLPYHTMDPAQAIERILEARGMVESTDSELSRQYEIFRRIRMNSMNGKEQSHAGK